MAHRASLQTDTAGAAVHAGAGGDADDPGDVFPGPATVAAIGVASGCGVHSVFRVSYFLFARRQDVFRNMAVRGAERRMPALVVSHAGNDGMALLDRRRLRDRWSARQLANRRRPGAAD